MFISNENETKYNFALENMDSQNSLKYVGREQNLFNINNSSRSDITRDSAT